MNVRSRILARCDALSMGAACSHLRGSFRAPRLRHRRSPGIAQYAPLGLLLIFFGNLTLTTLTHDWIGLLPYHDHLLLNARGIGLIHHAHHGDALAQAFQALQPVTGHDERRADTLPDRPGVLSLQGDTGLQPEMNTYTATGVVAAVGLWLLSRRGVRCPLPPFLPLHGCSPSPLLMPPRAA
jgi:hypothetical protein